MSRQAKQPIDLEPLELWEYAAVMPKLPCHWQLVYRILWETGIRIGEALKLTKKDLTDQGIWVTRLKKQNKPQRDHIPLPLDLLAALKAYAALRSGQKLFPYTTAGAWKALKMACEDAGIRRSLHPHLCRHGFARRVAKANLGLSPLDHIALLQRMLAHSSARTTLAYFKPSMGEAADIFRQIQGR